MNLKPFNKILLYYTLQLYDTYMKLLGNDTTSTNSYASGNVSNAHFANSTYSGIFL